MIQANSAGHGNRSRDGDENGPYAHGAQPPEKRYRLLFTPAARARKALPPKIGGQSAGG
jgi:hypothetical protein